MACLIPLAVDFDRFLDDAVSYSDEEIYTVVHLATSVNFSKPPRPQRQSKPVLQSIPILQSKPKVVRQSIAKAPAPLKVVPLTTMEWKKVMSEVKREYTNRRFSQCSSRCQDILDRVRDFHRVQNAHLIFLHFYSASALEMQVKGLHHTSLHRSKLLLQARHHYRSASELAQAEDEYRSRPQLRLSGTSSLSLHSPTTSLSSSSSVSTRASSPSLSNTSICTAKLGSDSSAKRRKRVRFDASLPNPLEEPLQRDEPIVRPDSPTLGFDEWLGRSSPDIVVGNGDALGGTFLSMVEHEDPSSFVFPMRPSEGAAEPQPSTPTTDEDLAARALSLERYRALLSGLKGQIASHLAMLEVDIAATKQTPSVRHGDADDMRKMELRFRIERLRAEGWPRRRFDAQRYEKLREDAMADLMM